MKILIYTFDWAPVIGGIQTMTMLLAKGLVAERADDGETIKVTLVTQTPRGEMDDTRLPYRVIRAPGLFRLASLLRDADLIHLAGPSLRPLILAVILRKPIVVEHHGFQTICPNGQLFYTKTQELCVGHFMAGDYRECIACNRHESYLRSINLWLLTFIRRWFCKHVSVNVTPTHWLAAQLQLPRTTTIYHGVAAPAPPAGEVRAPAPLTFAFLGRLVASKNVALLLRAAAVLRANEDAFRLFIIGDGLERERLEQLSSELGIESCVSFLHYLQEQELERVLADVTGIVVASASGEVFSLAVAENMLHGRIPIVPEACAVAEVIGEGGLTYPGGDAEALAERMLRLIKEPELVRQLGIAARNRAGELFRDQRMIDNHLRIYSDVLNR